MKEDFEEIMSAKYEFAMDFTKDEDGDYTDKFTALMYVSFIDGFNLGRKAEMVANLI